MIPINIKSIEPDLKRVYGKKWNFFQLWTKRMCVYVCKWHVLRTSNGV